jgi:hypothetical protein
MVSPGVGWTRGYDTHLTVDLTGGIEGEHVKDYGNQGAYACEGINLLRWMISTRNVTKQK